MRKNSWFCPSITYYKYHLITFGGDCLIERPEEDHWEFVSLINIFNPELKSWNCVGEIPHGYYLGKSVHISNNKILLIGGRVGKVCVSDESLLTVCSVLTIAPKDMNWYCWYYSYTCDWPNLLWTVLACSCSCCNVHVHVFWSIWAAIYNSGNGNGQILYIRVKAL